MGRRMPPWFNKQVIGAVLDQGQCATCSPVAVCDWLTIAARKKLGHDIPAFSPQEIINTQTLERECDYTAQYRHWSDEGAKFAFRYGLPSVKDFPYKGELSVENLEIYEKPEKRMFPPFRSYKFFDRFHPRWRCKTFWTKTIPRKLDEYPMVMTFDTGLNFSDLSPNEIYSTEMETDNLIYLHDMVVPACNVTNRGVKYYVGKNSWNIDWCNKGFGLLLQDQDRYPVHSVLMIDDDED